MNADRASVWNGAISMKTFRTIREDVVLELSLGAEAVTVTVELGTDLSKAFSGTCTETGDRLRFREPWAFYIEVM
jgi:hypothetical protein|tara:strand:- start:2277 stop:2501 length:225 start_codon:yes stop_codon:yes gene_type:complete